MILFKINWPDSPNIELSDKIYAPYLVEFGQLFFKSIIKCAKEFIATENSRNDHINNLNIFENELLDEILMHSYLCVKCALKFHGREDLLNEVYFYQIK